MHKWMQRHTLLLLTAILIVSCGVLPSSPPEIDPTATQPPPTPTETSPGVATPSNRVITLWVAPSFAPNPETPAGALLSDHLTEFENQHANLSVEVRIKSRSGAGSLLTTLTAANVAAPSTMPDLVMLEAHSLSEAASRGLLIPLDGLLDIPAEPEWYPHALSPMRFDSQTVGMPFASETTILAFRTDLYPSAPRRIETLLAEGHSFQFPAGDPNAQFTLAQYIALAGTLTNANGEPVIRAEELGEVLSFYQAAVEANVLPLTVRQWTDETQTWSEIQARRTASAVVPLSLFIQEHDPEMLGGSPLPTITDSGIGLADTWSWGLVAKSNQSSEIQVDLLTHLMDPAFLGPWTHALGLLPPNGATLAAWPEGTDSALVSRLVTVTRSIPPRSLRAGISAALLEAVEAVLTGTLTPAAAAQAAADAVAAP